MAAYETVIGMEVHVELQTASKMFCRCPAHHFQVEANRHICPVCTAQPGALPVINGRAVELTAMTGLALNCQVQPRSVFARKNYVYPDLPKGYQISQYELPLCTAGWVEVEGKRIGIERVHLEEDTGKLVHQGGASLVDYNRAGVPLMEIVSDSSLRSAEEAYTYLVAIRQVVRYLGASSGDMEKGAMRCEANISVRLAGATAYGTKVEVKNLNSFRAVRNAIAYETGRQVKLLDEGGQVRQVTMGWDEEAGVTREQRSKETSEDYRYFPEPDLLPVVVDEAWLADIQARLQTKQFELPQAKVARFAAEYGQGSQYGQCGLSAQDINVTVENQGAADYFEDTFKELTQKQTGNPKLVHGLITGEMFSWNIPFDEVRRKVPPENLADLASLTGSVISLTATKQVLRVMRERDDQPKPVNIVAELGLEQISDTGALEQAVAEVLAANPDAVEKIWAGKDSAVKFLIGQVMKATRGKANPALVEELLRRQLAG